MPRSKLRLVLTGLALLFAASVSFGQTPTPVPNALEHKPQKGLGFFSEEKDKETIVVLAAYKRWEMKVYPWINIKDLKMGDLIVFKFTKQGNELWINQLTGYGKPSAAELKKIEAEFLKED